MNSVFYHQPKLTKEEVLEILNLFPHSAKVWCAGSAAIAPETADDIDIYLLPGQGKVKMFEEPVPVEHSSLHILRLSTGAHTVELVVDSLMPIDVSAYAPQLQEKLQFAYAFEMSAKEGGWRRKVQLFRFTKASGILTVVDLLNNFDLSCHAWAIDQAGNRVSHLKATVPALENIHLINSAAITPTQHNLNRLIQFRQRYGEPKSSVEPIAGDSL